MSTPGHTHMSTADCWTILEREHDGRLAVSRRGGEPDILAVTFVVHDGAIDIVNRDETLEVDGHDDAGWWSVVVRGRARPAGRPAAASARQVAGSIGAASSSRRPMVELIPDVITGRRFSDDEGERGSDPHPVSSPILLPGGGEHPRWSRPTPIPSRRPS